MAKKTMTVTLELAFEYDDAKVKCVGHLPREVLQVVMDHKGLLNPFIAQAETAVEQRLLENGGFAHTTTMTDVKVSE